MFEKGRRVHIWKSEIERIGTGLIKDYKFDDQGKLNQYLIEFNEPKPDQYFDETYITLDTWQDNKYYLPILGEITVDLMFDYWDMPLLYTGKTQSGHFYLFSIYDRNNMVIGKNDLYIGRYACVPISNQRMKEYLYGKITTYDLFVNSEDGFFFISTEDGENIKFFLSSECEKVLKGNLLYERRK